MMNDVPMVHNAEATTGFNLNQMCSWNLKQSPALMSERRLAASIETVPVLTVYFADGNSECYRGEDAISFYGFILLRSEQANATESLESKVSPTLPEITDEMLVAARVELHARDHESALEELSERLVALHALNDLLARSRHILKKLSDQEILSLRGKGCYFYATQETAPHPYCVVISPSGYVDEQSFYDSDICCLSMQESYSRPYYGADAVRVTYDLFQHIQQVYQQHPR